MPTVLHGLLAAALAIPAAPAMPAAPVTSRDCARFSGIGEFTADSRADLARIAVLDPGPLAEGLPALADVRLASATGTVDSTGQPYRSVATGRHADARILGLPGGGAGAFHAEPSRNAPVVKDLARFRAAGIATAGTGRSTAHATWDDGYRCGRTGPMTRTATMLHGLSILDGMYAGPDRTSLLKIGPTGSVQSATDLIELGQGRIGVRSGARVALTELALFAGTPQQITVRVVAQPVLEAISGGDRAHSAVTYRPAILEVRAAGKPVQVLKGAGTSVALGLLGGLEPGRPSPLQARISLGQVRQRITDRKARADVATLRIEVRFGTSRLLDVALGNLAVEAGAPDRVRQGGGDRPSSGGDRPSAGGDHPSSGGDRPSAGGDRPSSGGDRPRPGGDRPRPGGDYPGPGDSDDSGDSDGSQDDDDDGQGGDDTPDDGPDSPGGAVPSASPSPSKARADTPVVAVPAPNRDVLALTGADVTAFGYAGGGLVLVGLVALLLTRRRRARNN
ncbi:MAG TPA: hypothetical protein VN408_22750 [Actinoplanes sp.]|nr:hypothetical protein [Actinoplanes sp.]